MSCYKTVDEMIELFEKIGFTDIVNKETIPLLFPINDDGAGHIAGYIDGCAKHV